MDSRASSAASNGSSPSLASAGSPSAARRTGSPSSATASAASRRAQLPASAKPNGCSFHASSDTPAVARSSACAPSTNGARWTAPLS